MTVALLFVAALTALALAAFNLWLGFGVAACALLVGGLILGFGGRRGPFLVLLSGYVVLLVTMARLADSPALVLGLPVSTALLVYGIWPMPLAAALYYALVFRSSVLPDDRLEKFLAEHRRRRPGE